MEDDVIDSNNTDYVMQRIRQLYLQDSTVTLVLIGKCTWARRFGDVPEAVESQRQLMVVILCHLRAYVKLLYFGLESTEKCGHVLVSADAMEAA